MLPTYVQDINEKLVKYFGSQEGHPNFRLAWTTSETEKRFGEFDEYYKGTDIFLRSFKGLREVSKYPFKPDRWVLEKFTDATKNSELVENYSYEPFWIFEKDETYQEPVWKAVKFLVHKYLFEAKDKFTEKDIALKEQEEMDKEVDFYYDYFENESPYLASQFSHGTAVFISGDEKCRKT